LSCSGGKPAAGKLLQRALEQALDFHLARHNLTVTLVRQNRLEESRGDLPLHRRPELTYHVPP
jgi:hypothetical protein